MARHLLNGSVICETASLRRAVKSASQFFCGIVSLKSSYIFKTVTKVLSKRRISFRIMQSESEKSRDRGRFSPEPSGVAQAMYAIFPASQSAGCCSPT